MKSEMSVLTGHTNRDLLKDVFPPGTEIKVGDTKLMWDRSNADEVEAVRATFDKLIARGYLAFRAEGKEGTKGEQIKSFDPSAERMIMIPRIQGGSWQI